eukprot:6212739-Pleurochrysis_carterae.AAC.6
MTPLAVAPILNGFASSVTTDLWFYRLYRARTTGLTLFIVQYVITATFREKLMLTHLKSSTHDVNVSDKMRATKRCLSNEKASEEEANDVEGA